MIIAIDGPAGAGKGTIARYLANQFHLKHLDTGLLYRAVALKALQEETPLNNEATLAQIAIKLDLENLKDPLLRDESVGNAASKIAVFPSIREILTRHMRNFCRHISAPYQGAVLDGRDIGTVVCPDAHIKLFITATPEARAARRAQEMQESNRTPKNSAYLQQVLERDTRDQQRLIAPLEAAADAHIIDTTNMDIPKACEKAVQLIQAYTNT